MAHRFCTVWIADKIVVMERGRLMRSAHTELVSTRGTYSHVFNLQAVGYLCATS